MNSMSAISMTLTECSGSHPRSTWFDSATRLEMRADGRPLLPSRLSVQSAPACEPSQLAAPQFNITCCRQTNRLISNVSFRKPVSRPHW